MSICYAFAQVRVVAAAAAAAAMKMPLNKTCSSRLTVVQTEQTKTCLFKMPLAVELMSVSLLIFVCWE